MSFSDDIDIDEPDFDPRLIEKPKRLQDMIDMARNLAEGFADSGAEQIIATPPLNTHVIPAGPAPSLYYRVVVEP